jgi:hypothetical protein
MNWMEGFPPAPPRFDVEALTGVLEIVGDPSVTIRRGLRTIAPPDWRGDAVSRLFGLESEEHCFHSSPHLWANFHEPQITAGFAHFLGLGDAVRRRERALAFMRAAARCAGGALDEADLEEATFRCSAEESRTDVLVECRTATGRFGVSLEAKFGHRLTAGQLPKAFAHARDVCGWDMERSMLLVVASDTEALDGAVLRANRRKGWVATSWWSLLDRLEREMHPDFDCLDYRRFRRTVWHRAY